jgi:hypothetical protein
LAYQSIKLMAATLTTTARRALAAYGGEQFWRRAQRISAIVSVRGLALVLKNRPFLDRARLELEIHRPYGVISPIGKNGSTSGILDGQDAALANDRDGTMVRRQDARSHFGWNRRLLWWDDLDMAYFANYAFWNYFTFPALLLNKAISWHEPTDGELIATFSDTIPTHCRTQHFYFSRETGLLSRLDYRVDIIGRFTRAGHVVVEHAIMNGVTVPALRRVTPRGPGGTPLPGPVLIEIRVHECTVSFDETTNTPP